MAATVQSPDISAMLDLVGGSWEHSTLYRYLREHHDAIIAKAAGERMNWRRLCSFFGQTGLTNLKGEAPTTVCARQTWYRVKKNIAALRARLTEEAEEKAREKERRRLEREAATERAAAAMAPPVATPARLDPRNQVRWEDPHGGNKPNYSAELLSACAPASFPMPAASPAPVPMRAAAEQAEAPAASTEGLFLAEDINGVLVSGPESLPPPEAVGKYTFPEDHTACALGLLKITSIELVRRWPALGCARKEYDIRSHASGVENGTLRVRDGDISPLTRVPWRYGADLPGYRSKLDFDNERLWLRYAKQAIVESGKSQQEMTREEFRISLASY
ncbi:MAG: hypothetical protein ABF479_01110 [Gluconacetobacter sp.]